MLKQTLIHPRILDVLARAGHHATVLIADGNYPASTKRGPQSEVVCLNLSPGVVSAAQALAAVLSAAPVDRISTMGIPPDDPYAQQGEPPVWSEYRRVIAAAGAGIELESIDKWQFYEAVMSPDHVLTIQTGETSLWANLLLTLGCRRPEA